MHKEDVARCDNIRIAGISIGQSIQLGENVEPNEYPQAFILALLNPKSSNVFACASKTSPAVFTWN